LKEEIKHIYCITDTSIYFHVKEYIFFSKKMFNLFIRMYFPQLTLIPSFLHLLINHHLIDLYLLGGGTTREDKAVPKPLAPAAARPVGDVGLEGGREGGREGEGGRDGWMGGWVGW